MPASDGPAPVFEGVGVALLTFFTSDGELDAKTSAAHAARLVDAGVRAVIVAGSTGEAAALSGPERVELLQAVRAAVPAGVAVVAGTGAPSARQAATFTADAVGAGADAVLALSPPGSRQLTAYYRQVASAAAGRPVLAYHYPAMSAPGVPLATLADLPVAGIKDSSDDPSRLLAELTAYSGWVYVGSPSTLPLTAELGATGAILAMANVEPERCVAAFGGDIEAHRALIPAYLRTLAGPPSVLKAMVAERYGTPTAARLA